MTRMYSHNIQSRLCFLNARGFVYRQYTFFAFCCSHAYPHPLIFRRLEHIICAQIICSISVWIYIHRNFRISHVIPNIPDTLMCVYVHFLFLLSLPLTLSLCASLSLYYFEIAPQTCSNKNSKNNNSNNNNNNT